jgi:hypothetical protein
VRTRHKRSSHGCGVTRTEPSGAAGHGGGPNGVALDAGAGEQPGFARLVSRSERTKSLILSIARQITESGTRGVPGPIRDQGLGWDRRGPSGRPASGKDPRFRPTVTVAAGVTSWGRYGGTAVMGRKPARRGWPVDAPTRAGHGERSCSEARTYSVPDPTGGARRPRSRNVWGNGRRRGRGSRAQIAASRWMGLRDAGGPGPVSGVTVEGPSRRRQGQRLSHPARHADRGGEGDGSEPRNSRAGQGSRLPQPADRSADGRRLDVHPRR